MQGGAELGRQGGAAQRNVLLSLRTSRTVLKGGNNWLCNAKINDRSQGHCLLYGHGIYSLY